MPVETVPGTSITYHLIAFDANGRERTDDPDGTISDLVVNKLRSEPITDVFIFSHGWMGDVPAAQRQYNKWIGAMAQCSGDISRMQEKVPGFNPLLIGLHWPSLPWGNEDLAAPPSFDIGAAPAAPEPAADQAVANFAAAISDTPEARAALETVINSAQAGVGPEAPEVQAAYDQLEQEAALGSGGPDDAPGSDNPPFNPTAIIQEAEEGDESAVSFGVSGFDPSILLSPLRTLSFWKMKDRGRHFGETGGRRLLASLQGAKEGVRFHLMGHSFGCVVVSSILAGPKSGGDSIKPVASLVLVQGALSLWSYCSSISQAGGKPGYFRPIVDRGAVQGPIVTTQSRYDKAVGFFYPLGARLAGQVDFVPESLPKYGGVGTWGLRGPGLQISRVVMKPVDQSYGFAAGQVYNLDSDQYIAHGDAFSGGHSDIAHPEVGHAVWEAAMATLY